MNEFVHHFLGGTTPAFVPKAARAQRQKLPRDNKVATPMIEEELLALDEALRSVCGVTQGVSRRVI